MIKNKCLVCGSFDLRADRALSGRLICNSCGNPYGVRRVGRNNPIRINNSLFKIDKLFFIFVLIIVFILIIT